MYAVQHAREEARAARQTIIKDPVTAFQAATFCD
jgi:hypothetical protein